MRIVLPGGKWGRKERRHCHICHKQHTIQGKKCAARLHAGNPCHPELFLLTTGFQGFSGLKFFLTQVALLSCTNRTDKINMLSPYLICVQSVLDFFATICKKIVLGWTFLFVQILRPRCCFFFSRCVYEMSLLNDHYRGLFFL